MSEVVTVKIRDLRGKRNARRLRRAGQVPAILYGHGRDNVCLSIPERELSAIVRHGARVVDLKGDLSETAFIREVQWDTLGVDMLHVDFTRVKAGEAVEATIPVELWGEAPGTKLGGIVEILTHELEIECAAASLPEKLRVDINSLELEGSIMAADVPLPEGAKLLTPDTVVVQCMPAAPVLEEEEEEAPPEAVEPEVIGRKAGEEEETGNQ
jgi:large subunit ribosomal protein L25